MVYNFLPFMVLPIYNTLAKIDDNVINAARDLGRGQLPERSQRSCFPLSVPWNRQRDHDGIRTGTHHLRDLEPPWAAARSCSLETS